MRRVGTQDRVPKEKNARDTGKEAFVGLATPATSGMKEVMPSKLLL